MPDWITVREAAEILGVQMSAVPKMVRRGDLTPREQRPRLEHAQVVALRELRAALSVPEQPPRTPRPPDDHHDWLDAHEAAALMDVGPEPSGSAPVADGSPASCTTAGGGFAVTTSSS